MATPSDRSRLQLSTAVLLLALLAGCGGGGGGGSATPGVAAPNAVSPAATPTAAASTAASPGPGGMAITGFGGLEGTATLTHTDGATFDYAEVVAFTFNHPVNYMTVGNSITVAPSAPFTVFVDGLDKRVQLTLRKTPGVTYAITFASGLQSTDGYTLPAAVTYHITTPATVTVPPPSQREGGQPYKYGVLVHPYPTSLSGTSAAQIVNILAAMHAGFVRIDYSGAQYMPAANTVTFALADQIAALLAAKNITMLPILEQYNTAPWQGDGQPYPAIYSTPQLYAQFVSTVVAHLRLTAPQVTRVELFNEPNLSGWWTSPNPTYAATDGSATAQYMLAGYAAAKSANPGITVVGPALAAGGNDVDPRTFLTNMYAAGCRTGACWDVLSVHNYSWFDPNYTLTTTTSSRWSIYQDLQAIAMAHGDPKPHVMLTEWAFSTSADPSSFDPQVQALYMAHGFNLMLADPTVDGIVWTNVYAPGTDFWSRTAVTDASFNPLPAESTFRTFATP